MIILLTALVDCREWKVSYLLAFEEIPFGKLKEMGASMRLSATNFHTKRPNGLDIKFSDSTVPYDDIIAKETVLKALPVLVKLTAAVIHQVMVRYSSSSSRTVSPHRVTYRVSNLPGSSFDFQVKRIAYHNINSRVNV